MVKTPPFRTCFGVVLRLKYLLSRCLDPFGIVKFWHFVGASTEPQEYAALVPQRPEPKRPHQAPTMQLRHQTEDPYAPLYWPSGARDGAGLD